MVYLFTVFGMVPYADSQAVPDADHLAVDTMCYIPDDDCWYKIVNAIQLGKVSRQVIKPFRNKWLMINAAQVPSEYRTQILLLT